MNIMPSITKSDKIKFEKNLRNFKAFPWSWIDILTSHPKYFLISIVFVYVVLAILTFFPENKWMAPLHFYGGYQYLESYLGYDQILFLITYPSINFLLIGFGVAVTLAIRWRHKIPQIFQWLWKSERIEAKNEFIEKEYQNFLQDFQGKLESSRGGITTGLMLVGLLIGLLLIAGAFEFIWNLFTVAGALAMYICIAIMLFWVFLIGQICWLLAVTSKCFSDLNSKFTICINPSHPDKCGGLKQLGDFWFDAAIPIIIGGLTFVLISFLNLDVLDDVIKFISIVLIFVLILPLTVLAIFIPLWSIHREMVIAKSNYQDSFAIQSRFLETEIQTHTDISGDINKAKIAKEKLEILQTIHPEKLPYPAWPFWFTPTILAAFSPQILITVIEIISKITDLF